MSPFIIHVGLQACHSSVEQRHHYTYFWVSNDSNFLSLSKAWISRCIVLSYIQYVHLDIHAPKQMFDILASYHKFESRDIAFYPCIRSTDSSRPMYTAWLLSRINNLTPPGRPLQRPVFVHSDVQRPFLWDYKNTLRGRSTNVPFGRPFETLVDDVRTTPLAPTI